jgi:hypothetical protein
VAAVWNDGSLWEDLLTLPATLPLAIVQRLVEMVA